MSEMIQNSGGMESGGSSAPVNAPESGVQAGGQGEGQGQGYDYSGSVERLEAELSGFEPSTTQTVHQQPGFEGNESAEGQKPANDGGSEVSDDDSPEFEEPLSPEERALNRLKEEDPEGYAALEERYRQAEEIRAEREREAYQNEVAQRLAEGDLFADVAPEIGAAWKTEFADKHLQALYGEMNKMSGAMAEGIANEFFGSVIDNAMEQVRNLIRMGNDVDPEIIGSVLKEVAQATVPNLRSGILQDFDEISTKFNEASINASKIAHRATVEGNQSRAKLNEVHAMFGEKVQEIESSLGRKFTEEERGKVFKRFAIFAKSDPTLTHAEAMEEAFAPYLDGIRSGKEQGRREAVQKSTRLGHENAHRGGKKPSQRGGMASDLAAGMDIEAIIRKYA